MLNDELMDFTAFLMTKGKMPELTFGEVIDLVHAFRREHGYRVNTTDDTQPKRDTQKKLNQNSAQSFKQFDFALDRMSETIRSTKVLLGEIVDSTADRFDRVFGDFADAIADLKERSGVKD